MKHRNIFKRLIIPSVVVLVIILGSCGKGGSSSNPSSPSAPQLTTSAVTATTQSTAICGGTITAINDPSNTTLQCGVVWDTKPNPVGDVYTTKTTVSNGAYRDTLTGLSGGTTYYVRAYAKNITGFGYGQEISFTTPTPAIALGNSLYGGVIFYIDATHVHGLVTCPLDYFNTVNWDNGNYYLVAGTLSTSTAFGTGKANTTTIISALGSATHLSAASAATSMNLNGYSDWYLPSRDELSTMKTNLVGIGTGNFGIGSYWSSSLSVSGGFAYTFSFLTNSASNTPVGNYAQVRAIRAF